MPRRILLTLIVSVLAFGCVRPNESEFFVRKDHAQAGVYDFYLDLSDSLSTYDFWLVARAGRKPMANLRLDVCWTAPDGETFIETVYMPNVDYKGVKELYRKDIVPSVYGRWHLFVIPYGTDDDFCGIGLVSRDNHGTR